MIAGLTIILSKNVVGLRELFLWKGVPSWGKEEYNGIKYAGLTLA
jgi:hypothetical protein